MLTLALATFPPCYIIMCLKTFMTSGRSIFLKTKTVPEHPVVSVSIQHLGLVGLKEREASHVLRNNLPRLLLHHSPGGLGPQEGHG